MQQRKAQASAKLYRQPRDTLHQAAKNVVDFCAQQGVTYQVVADMRDLQTGVSLGKATNQKISQWPHGPFVRYLREKATRRGITLEWIDEAYSTKTCSASSHQIFGQDTPAVRPDTGRGRNGRLLSVSARRYETSERSRAITRSHRERRA